MSKILRELLGLHGDEAAREAITRGILDYNRENLDVTWEVLKWSKSLAWRPCA